LSAGRGWVRQALEAGIVSTEVLKVAQSSVHAVPAGIHTERRIEARLGAT
jgi:hypothetical protein